MLSAGRAGVLGATQSARRCSSRFQAERSLAVGAGPEEAAAAIPPFGHSVPAGSGRADSGDAAAIADFRKRTWNRSRMRTKLGVACWTRSSGCIRLVNAGCLLGWVKRWLEIAVVEDDGNGGHHRTNRVRRERKWTPQGAPISPLVSSIHMRRFTLGGRRWATLGGSTRKSSIAWTTS